jgi:hypothetical protein
LQGCKQINKTENTKIKQVILNRLDGCAAGFDGCNGFMKSEGNWKSTNRYCEAGEREEAYCTQIDYTTCKAWFDGCNNCEIMDSINPNDAVCTERWCDPDQYMRPYCIRLKNNS